jgi:hypothetical protein
MFNAMSESLDESFKEIDRDLDHSWIDLSTKVRELAAGLKLKAAGSHFAADADHLAQDASLLCDHVERLHADVIDLLASLEAHLPLPETDSPADAKAGDLTQEEIRKEAIQIQREHHELRNDFKDVIKALFMWRDNPVERAREKR